MFSQSHPLVSVAPQSNFQNLSLASQTQPQPAQASQDQALATLVSLIQCVPAPSFKAQHVGLRVIPAVQDFPALYENQQAPPQSSALVREIALSQSSLAQEIPKKPVAQALKPAPPASQELSQEVPDTVFLLPESPAPSSQGQQSVPPETASVPAWEKNSHPL